MQYLKPVGPGPSGKTWPKWAPQEEQSTSVLRIPNLKSVFLVILSFWSASLTLSTKLGHPDPESNFFLLEKRAVPQQTQLYTPFSLLSLYLPVQARSVPPPLATWYWTLDRSSLHSASVTLFGFSFALSARSGAHLDRRVSWSGSLFECTPQQDRNMPEGSRPGSLREAWSLREPPRAVFLTTFLVRPPATLANRGLRRMPAMFWLF